MNRVDARMVWSHRVLELHLNSLLAGKLFVQLHFVDNFADVVSLVWLIVHPHVGEPPELVLVEEDGVVAGHVLLRSSLFVELASGEAQVVPEPQSSY